MNDAENKDLRSRRNSGAYQNEGKFQELQNIHVDHNIL